jgi:hypothetical protein
LESHHETDRLADYSLLDSFEIFTIIDIKTKEVLAVSRRFIMGYGGDNSKLCDASNPNAASPIGINNLDDLDFLRWVYGKK